MISNANFLTYLRDFESRIIFYETVAMCVSLDAYDGQVFDRRNLLRMQGYLDPASFREIIEEFSAALKGRLRDLDRSERSPTDIDPVCHDLLNFAGTLGLFELKAAAEHLSVTINHDMSKIEAAISDVRIAGARALLILVDYLNVSNS